MSSNITLSASTLSKNAMICAVFPAPCLAGILSHVLSTFDHSKKEYEGFFHVIYYPSSHWISQSDSSTSLFYRIAKAFTVAIYNSVYYRVLLRIPDYFDTRERPIGGYTLIAGVLYVYTIYDAYCSGLNLATTFIPRTGDMVFEVKKGLEIYIASIWESMAIESQQKLQNLQTVIENIKMIPQNYIKSFSEIYSRNSTKLQ